jgi:Glyoxalase/Bleomycin resistance protein/Dioxygenase superfamily
MLRLNKENKERLITGSFISNIVQIAIITRNLESTVRELSERFGVGPFKGWNHTSLSLLNTKFRGRESPWSAKIALAWVGNIQLEVVQPSEGLTLYDQYLNEHGEGVQHLLINSDYLSFEQTVEKIVTAGFPVVQEGIVSVPIHLGFIKLPRPHFAHKLLCPKFAYLDTKDAIKTSLELIKIPPPISYRQACKIGKGDYFVPEGSIDINATLPNSFINKIFKVGIITRDLDATIRSYIEHFKVGPWKVYKLQASKIAQMKMRGKDAEFSIRLAIAYIGDTWIEIVEPLDGASLYREFLDAHGEGIHYLGVSTGDLSFSEAIEKFTSLDCPVLMEGELENAYRFAHLDTKPFIKTTLEIISISVDEITTALERIKPDQVYPFE